MAASPAVGDHTKPQVIHHRLMNTSMLPAADWEARVATMLPLVRHVVSDVAGRLPRFVDRDDLMAAGMLGLTQAARSYDASRGVTFQAYARLRIRGAVLDELRSRDWVSRGTRTRANQASAAAAKLQRELGRTPTDDEVANELVMDVSVLRRIREDVVRASALERSSSSPGAHEVADEVPALDAGPLAHVLDAELRGYLIDGVAALPERLRIIIISHFFDGREMKDIAQDLGVTASRVSQLCAEAIRLLRDGLNAQLDPGQVPDLDATKGRVARRKADYYRSVAAASSPAQRLDTSRTLQHAVAAQVA
jgi:RNA polymerase sigma factor for flagellar operon FliA